MSGFPVLCRTLKRCKSVVPLVLSAGQLQWVPTPARSKLPIQFMSLFSLIKSFSTPVTNNDAATIDESELEVVQEEQLDMAKLLSEADDLLHESKYKEVYEMLVQFQDDGGPDVLWRLSRALYYLSRRAKTELEHKGLIMEGFEFLRRALLLDDANPAVHKWYSIFLDARVTFDGLKARIDKLSTVKKHMQKAVELNPKDAVTLHLLGNWCFNIAEVPWYQRHIARLVYSEPPESTYEEALSYFLKAEEVNPRFYSHNILMVGKCYLKLHKFDRARFYLVQALQFPAQSDEEQSVRKEADELLSKMPAPHDYDSFANFTI